MRIQRISIADFLGIRSAELDLRAPVALIAGSNGAGKSSIRDAVALALTADLGRVGLKKEAPTLIRGDAKSASIEVVDSDGDAWAVSITRSGTIHDTLKGRQPDPVLPYVLDAQRLAQLSPTERRAFLFGLMGVKQDAPSIRAALVGRLFAGRQQQPDEAARIERITPLLRTGFDGAHKEAKSLATEAKGAWRTVTGETYGSEKAKTWKAAIPAFDAAAAALVATKLKHIEAALDGWQKTLGGFEADQRRRTELRANLPALFEVAGRAERIATKLAVDEETLAYVQHQLEQAQAAAGAAPRVGLVHELAVRLTDLMAGMTPPGEGDELEGVWDAAQEALDAYVKQHGEIYRAGAAVDPQAQARLPELQRAHTTASSAVAHDRRDLAAAQQAQRDADAIEAELAETPDADSATEARAQVDALKAERTALQAEADKLRSLKASVEAAEAKTAAAARHHADVAGWDEIAQALGPDGLPADMLSEALGPLNARLAQSALDTEWPRVEITADMQIRTGLHEREYRLLSESERWRVDAMLAEAVAHVSQAGLLVLDRMDVLDLRGRGELLAWLDVLASNGEIGTALVFATLKGLPQGLPETTQAFWVDGGVCGQPATAQVAEAA